jgi:hypothetical protein
MALIDYGRYRFSEVADRSGSNAQSDPVPYPLRSHQRRPYIDETLRYARIEFVETDVFSSVLSIDTKPTEAEAGGRRFVVRVLIALSSAAFIAAVVFVAITIYFVSVDNLRWAISGALSGLICAALFVVGVKLCLDAGDVFRELKSHRHSQ